jgi:hypothetical protein
MRLEHPIFTGSPFPANKEFENMEQMVDGLHDPKNKQIHTKTTITLLVLVMNSAGARLALNFSAKAEAKD